jgi:hypothetical protein
MSTLENTIHYETALEQFECFCNDNLDFSDSLVEFFGEGIEQYKVWKEDCYDTRHNIESAAFDVLYDFDAELLVRKPIQCLYKHQTQHTEEQ